ncbi:hypothetical protein SUGI_0560460 [Cryptomeria japonica]|nr:hypothetical protein SUGI_0560460 [Cryptomeria japonica]
MGAAQGWLEVWLFYVRVRWVEGAMSQVLLLRHVHRAVGAMFEIHGAKVPALAYAGTGLTRTPLRPLTSTQITFEPLALCILRFIMGISCYFVEPSTRGLRMGSGAWITTLLCVWGLLSSNNILTSLILDTLLQLWRFMWQDASRDHH